MKKEESFKQRIQADVALIESKLIRFKARGMGFTTAAKDRHEEQVERLEQKIDTINERMGEFNEVDERLREDFMANIETCLQELQVQLEKTTQSFTTEPGVPDEHGNDDGPFPYGEGLIGRKLS